MFTVDDYFRVLKFLKENPDAHLEYQTNQQSYIDAANLMQQSLNFSEDSLENDEFNLIQASLNAKKDSETYFTKVLDQIPFRTKDAKLLQGFMVDWYAANKTFIDIMRKTSDPFSLPSDQLDLGIRGFGAGLINENTVPDITTRALFLLALCELYKIKGSPQSIYTALDFTGFRDCTIREWWLEKHPYLNELQMKGIAINKGYYYDEDAGQYLPVDDKIYEPAYLTWDTFEKKRWQIGDPHWFYKKSEILAIHNDKDVKMKLPSITPYFSIVVPMDYNKHNQLISMIERMLSDQFNDFVQGNYVPLEISVADYPEQVSLLSLYLGFCYTQVRYDEFNKRKELLDYLSNLDTAINPYTYSGVSSTDFDYPYSFEKLAYWCIENTGSILSGYTPSIPLYTGATNELKYWWENIENKDWEDIPDEFFDIFGYERDLIDYTEESVLYYTGDQYKTNSTELDYYEIFSYYDELLNHTDFARRSDWDKYHGTYYASNPSNATINPSTPQLEHVQNYYNDLSNHTILTLSTEHDGSSLDDSDSGKLGQWAVDALYFYHYYQVGWIRYAIEITWSDSTALKDPTDEGELGEWEYDDDNQYMYRCVRRNLWIRYACDDSWTDLTEIVNNDSDGFKGDYRYSDDYMYFCTDESNWVRVATTSTWSEAPRPNIINIWNQSELDTGADAFTFYLTQSTYNSNVMIFATDVSGTPLQYQRKNIDYTQNGTEIVFTSAPGATPFAVYNSITSPILPLWYKQELTMDYSSSSTGDIIDSTSIQLDRMVNDDMLVFLNGHILSYSDDYTIDGNILTFTSPPSGRITLYYSGETNDVVSNSYIFWKHELLTRPNGNDYEFSSPTIKMIDNVCIFVDGEYYRRKLDYDIIGSIIKFHDDLGPTAEVLAVDMHLSYVQNIFAINLYTRYGAEKILRGHQPCDVLTLQSVVSFTDLPTTNLYEGRIAKVIDSATIYEVVDGAWATSEVLTPLTVRELYSITTIYEGMNVLVRDAGNGETVLYEYQQVGSYLTWLPSRKCLDEVNLGFDNNFIEWIDEVGNVADGDYGQIASDLLEEFSTYISGKIRNLNINIQSIFDGVKTTDFLFDVINFFKPKRVRLLFYALHMDIDDRLFNSLVVDDSGGLGMSITHNCHDHIRGNEQNFDGLDPSLFTYEGDGTTTEFYLRYIPLGVGDDLGDSHIPEIGKIYQISFDIPSESSYITIDYGGQETTFNDSVSGTTYYAFSAATTTDTLTVTTTGGAPSNIEIKEIHRTRTEVCIDNVRQTQGVDYIIAENGLTFTTAPDNGTVITVNDIYTNPSSADYVSSVGMIRRSSLDRDLLPRKLFDTTGDYEEYVTIENPDMGLSFHVHGESNFTISAIHIYETTTGANTSFDIYSSDMDRWNFKGAFSASGNNLVFKDGDQHAFHGEAVYMFDDPDELAGTETQDYINIDETYDSAQRKIYKIEFHLDVEVETGPAVADPYPGSVSSSSGQVGLTYPDCHETTWPNTEYGQSYLTMAFAGVNIIETDQSVISGINITEQDYVKGTPTYHFDYYDVYDTDVDITVIDFGDSENPIDEEYWQYDAATLASSSSSA